MRTQAWILLMAVHLSNAAFVPIKGPFTIPPWLRLYADPGLYPIVPSKSLTIRDPNNGLIRPISYFVNDQGMAIYDGDVAFGSEASLLANAAGVHKRDEDLGDTNTTAHKKRSYSVNWDYPDGNIPYYFATTNDATILTGRVNTAIARWLKVAPYLKFTDLGVGNPNGKFGINITSQFSGCYTSPAATYKQFGPFAMNLNATNCNADTAVHEFGHALGKSSLYPSVEEKHTNRTLSLGLIHEHQRPDAAKTITFQCANVAPVCTNMPPGTNCCNTGLPAGCCANVAQFTVINDPGYPARYDYSSPYDLNSVMQYVGAAFANPGTFTLSVVNPANTLNAFSNPTDPSPGDAERVCKIYKSRCQRAIDCANQGCAARCTHPIKSCTGAASCGG